MWDDDLTLLHVELPIAQSAIYSKYKIWFEREKKIKKMVICAFPSLYYNSLGNLIFLVFKIRSNKRGAIYSYLKCVSNIYIIDKSGSTAG